MADDHELWDRIWSRDADAFEAFYRDNARRLCAYLRQIVGNAQAAEDVTQETFTQIWRSPNGFRPELGSLRGYLFGIGRKLGAEWWRKQGANPDQGVEKRNDAFVEAAPSFSAIGDAFARLPEEQRSLPEHLALFQQSGEEQEMNCKEAAECVSALFDGEPISRETAGHLSECEECLVRLNEYAEFGAELRRLASLDEAAPVAQVDWRLRPVKEIGWWQKGLTTMRIPKLAFGVMLIAIIALSTGLVIVRAQSGATTGRFLELKYKLPTGGQADICVLRADGSQKGNSCDFVDHGREGLLLMNTRLITNSGHHAQLRIRAKYVPGAGETEVDYNDALFKDVPESLLPAEPGEKQKIQVAGLGAVEVEVEYLDHIPPLVYRPQETLDPNPREFRIVAPVLVRDNQVIANEDGSSIGTGTTDATLMFYVPGEGRYLISSLPFESAVVGSVHLGKITFSLEGHNYLLLTSMPITVSDHVWVKHEPDFKPSERMVRASDARDDRPMYLVRSLKKLEEQRIQH